MKVLKPEDEQFRRLVVTLDGRQQDIAEALGITRLSVTRRLLSEKHCRWWCAFKEARSRRRRRARDRKHYARAKQRKVESETVKDTRPLETEALRLLLETL